METTLPKTARFVVDDKGEKTDVIMPVADLYELMEDLYDAAVAHARLEDEDIPWEEAKRRLRAADGEV